MYPLSRGFRVGVDRCKELLQAVGQQLDTVNSQQGLVFSCTVRVIALLSSTVS
jgi:hypothetical protein